VTVPPKKREKILGVSKNKMLQNSRKTQNSRQKLFFRQKNISRQIYFQNLNQILKIV
jgi:hypothetical protein